MLRSRWTRRGLLVTTLTAVLAACAPAPGGGGAGGPTVTGTPCPGETGVTVVVDFTALADRIEVGCAPGPQASGLAALAAAGFVTEPADGVPGSVCTVDGLPSEGYPYCWLDGGYWGYYRSDGTAPWDYSPVGAGDGPLVQGTIEGWAWAPGFVGDVPRVDPTAL